MSGTPRILRPLPDTDFDPTESATPWRASTARGWEEVVATDNGGILAADERMVLGIVRGPLGAGPRGLAAHRPMARSAGLQSPIR
jgi:hypothetical protein